METDERASQPDGHTRTAASTVIWADASDGLAYAATLGEGESFTTVELKINFFRAVGKGMISPPVAKVIKEGSTLG